MLSPLTVQVVATFCSQEITSPSGVVITEEQEMFGVKSYANVYLQLQKADLKLRNQWKQTTKRLRQMASQFTKGPRLESC